MTNLGWPVRIVASGGIPVTEALNGLGIPYVEAELGVAVTFCERGIPISGTGAPAGFSLWTTGNQVWQFGALSAISPART